MYNPEAVTTARQRVPRPPQYALKASISVDIIFVCDSAGVVKPYVVELNGDNSGIKGFIEATKHTRGESRQRHIFAQIRGRVDNQYNELAAKHNAFVDKIKMLKSAGNLSEYGEDKAERIARESLEIIHSLPLFKNSYENDERINLLASRKDFQNILLGDIAPRMYEPGKSAMSSTGLWMIKPNDGLGGKGIFLMNNVQFNSFLCSHTWSNLSLVAQEFMLAQPADLDTRTDGHYCASLRMLYDFVYDAENNEVVPTSIFTYQRIAEDAVPESPNLDLFEKSVVVNLGKGANAIYASAREELAARVLAEKVARRLSLFILAIENIESEYKSPLALSDSIKKMKQNNQPRFDQ